MKKLLFILLLNSFFSWNVLAMHPVPLEEETSSSAMIGMKFQSNTLGVHEGGDEEPIPFRPSLTRKCGGQCVKASVIVGWVVVGGSIGFGIMCNQYPASLSATMVKATLPLIIGSVAGYVVGKVTGSLAKKRFIERWRNT